MNTYDFDKTLSPGDCELRFLFYNLRHHPLLIIKNLPKLTKRTIEYKLGKASYEDLLRQLYSYLPHVKDIDKDIERFWNINSKRIYPWYFNQRRDDDVIISASPEFLLRPLAEKLNVRLIATRVDKDTGEVTGLNCHDVEKARRFKEEFPGEEIEEFYSDALCDAPMAEISRRAYLVTKGKPAPWPGK